MTRPRDIAVELFGEKEGALMPTVDLYQTLARSIIQKVIILQSEPLRLGTSSSLDHSTLQGLVRLVHSHTNEAMLGAAYEFGYKAQMEDATAQEEANSYDRLEELTAVYKELYPSVK